MDKQAFLKQCKTNREILELSYEDMSNCLIDMNVKEYKAFENGSKNTISKENLKRIYRVLCLEETNLFNLNDYIDTEGLSKEEILDIASIVEKLVGDLDD